MIPRPAPIKEWQKFQICENAFPCHSEVQFRTIFKVRNWTSPPERAVEQLALCFSILWIEPIKTNTYTNTNKMFVEL
jgi:hypothetical protein